MEYFFKYLVINSEIKSCNDFAVLHAIFGSCHDLALNKESSGLSVPKLKEGDKYISTSQIKSTL